MKRTHLLPELPILPELVTDVIFCNGRKHIVIRNISDRSAIGRIPKNTTHYWFQSNIMARVSYGKRKINLYSMIFDESGKHFIEGTVFTIRQHNDKYPENRTHVENIHIQTGYRHVIRLPDGTILPFNRRKDVVLA